MKMPNWQTIALILAVLAILPIWLIDVAPLADWPFHLAISNESFLILNNQIQSNFYNVDLSFLGYTLPHLLLVFLQNFFDIFTSGKLFLSLLFVMSIVCWYYAFELIDSSKKGYFILGLVANQSIYYFLGMISFLFAVHIAILWLAVLFTKKLAPIPKIVLFAFLGILVYLSHGQVFFLLSIPMLAYLFIDALSKKQKISAILAIIQILLVLAAVVNVISTPTLERDLTYSMELGACNLKNSILFEHSQFEQKTSFAIEFFGGIYANFFSLIPLGYFIPLLSNPVMVLAIFILLIALMLKSARIINSEKMQFPKLNLGKFVLNKKFALLSAYFYLYFLMVPFNAASIYFLNERSIPFLFAFLALAFKNQRLDELIPKVLVAIVTISLVFQAVSFYTHASEQQEILFQIKKISEQIPAKSAVMIFSGEWNSRVYTPFSPIQKNPQYHALLLIYNPNIYISNMFLTQDTFILRSNFPIYDEFRIWYSSNKPLDDLVYEKCYSPLPSEFDYYVDRNMTLRKNPDVQNISTKKEELSE